MISLKIARLTMVGLTAVLMLATTAGPYLNLTSASPMEKRVLLDTYESLLNMSSTLSPEPILGQDVVWHIKLSSSQPELPNTKLTITLPEGVELVSGEASYVVDIPAGGKVSIDLVIRVTEPGEWKISAFAGVSFGSQAGFGVALCVTMSETTLAYNSL